MFRSSLKWAAAFAAALALASPTVSGELSPVGNWQTVTGESRYRVVTCGSGTICAKLTWLRSDARTEENVQYLNKYVLEGAQQTGANRWSGQVSYNGDTYGGNMTLVSAERLKLSGCMAIFCQSMEFVRI